MDIKTTMTIPENNGQEFGDARILNFHRCRHALITMLRNKLKQEQADKGIHDQEKIEREIYIFMERLNYTWEIVGASTENWLEVKLKFVVYLAARHRFKGYFTTRRSDKLCYFNELELAIVDYWHAITGVWLKIPANKFCTPDQPKKPRWYAIFEHNAKASAALLERKRLQALEQQGGNETKTKTKPKNKTKKPNTKTV